MSWLERHREETITTIVATLLPTHPTLEPPSRSLVGAEVGRFVVSQVRALPDFLRIPYGLGLLAFAWLPILRWGRSFHGLDATRRAAWIALWSDAGLGAPRNFMKLLRSCTLLAYYDHATVRAHLEPRASTPPTPIRASAGGA